LQTELATDTPDLSNTQFVTKLSKQKDINDKKMLSNDTTSEKRTK
jgi:hypothetical protein